MVEKVELTDGFILLRPHNLGDIQLQNEAVCESIPEISAWMEWCHPGYSIEESRTWVNSRDMAWENGTDYDFAIIDPKDGRYLGACGLNSFKIRDKIANLGYWVRTTRTRQGIATAATRLLARFGFDELKLNRIEIVVATGNRASQLVAEKSGATREGVARSRFLVGDKILDAVMFSLIPQDIP